MTTKIPAELSSTPGISDSSDATAITIDSSENVGIGTTSPSEKLTVSGKTQSSEFRASSGAGGKGYDFSASGSGAGVANIFCPAGYTLGFGTNSTERMRITSGGNVGIGTSAIDTAYSGYVGLELGAQATINGNRTTSDTGVLSLNANAYLDGSANWKFKEDGKAAQIQFTDNGQFDFRNTNSSGSADGAITFETRLKITDEGIIRASNSNNVAHYASDAGTQWVSLADDSSIGLTDTTAGSMLVCVYDGGTGSGALYFANYYGQTSILASNGNRLFATSDTDGKICVYKDSFSHVVTFKNRTGVNITVFAVSVFAAHI